MARISITPVGYACGARVTGIDVSKPLPPEDVATIRKAWIEHLVLVFPGQSLEPASMMKFSRNFGELDDYATQPFNRHPEINEVMVLTNKRTNGQPSKTYNAGQNWHTDLSYTLRPAKGTSVYCMEKPSVGGDTMFANMYLAFETLSPKMQAFVESLEGVHDASLIEGLDKRGPEVANEFRRLNPPVVHPAVRVHPESGRKALYVNQRVRNFVGLSEAESKPIVKFLCEHSVSPRFTYRHYWSVGDLVMWDNRCLVHLAVGDYDPAEIRHMIRTSGVGDYVGRYLEPGNRRRADEDGCRRGETGGEPEVGRRAARLARLGLGSAFERLLVELARSLFLFHVVDFAHHAVQVDGLFHALEAARQDGIGRQLAGLVERPDFLAVVGGAQFRREAAEVGSQVVDVALEHQSRADVARGIHGLRQVDDHRPMAVDEHVVLGQVAVDDARAQHFHDLPDQDGVELARLLGRELEVVEPRRGVAVVVRHQLHEQHAVEEIVRLRHAHACGGQSLQGAHLGVLPGLFEFLAAEFRAFLHGPRAAAVLDVAALRVLDRVPEGALFGFLVDLGAADFLAAAHDEDDRFLAAHELAEDFVDEAFLDQRKQSFRGFDGRLFALAQARMGTGRFYARAAPLGSQLGPVRGNRLAAR